jgi:hypothetical protein
MGRGRFYRKVEKGGKVRGDASFSGGKDQVAVGVGGERRWAFDALDCGPLRCNYRTPQQ